MHNIMSPNDNKRSLFCCLGILANTMCTFLFSVKAPVIKVLSMMNVYSASSWNSLKATQGHCVHPQTVDFCLS